MRTKKPAKRVDERRSQIPVKQSADKSQREAPAKRPPARPLARMEMDDFAVGPREADSDRGGFVSEHTDANPGGTTGEHSGQRTKHRRPL